MISAFEIHTIDTQRSKNETDLIFEIIIRLYLVLDGVGGCLVLVLICKFYSLHFIY